MQRITSLGGQVYRCVNDNSEPLRVWVKYQNYPGLAMTRCFGDQIAKHIGVTSKPDVQFFEIKPENKTIIIASDGVWDAMSI